ncbi:MAG: PAS domain-containing protein [Planctomycetales bacterium]|nr:PAS domain-containing protein [Planctomycetales bacterium]NIP69308.1 PAS domain-containing protein [Planctomycetales bacterium]
MKPEISSWLTTLFPTLATFLLASGLATTGLAQDNQPPLLDPAKQLAAVTTLMDSIPDIIFYKDMDGVYRGGNKAWTQLIGKPMDQILGKTDLDLFPAQLAKAFRQRDQKMLATRQPRRNEEWVSYPDGRHVLLDTLKTPWVDSRGNVLGVLGICREITPNPAAEKEVRAANDQFYAGLNAMFTGELGPMKAIWSHADDVTYMGPVGGFQVGWDAVRKEWEAQAALKLGGKVEASEMQFTVGKDLAVVSNWEKGENTNAQGQIQKVSIRATNIFRKEDQQWKMIGHHVDLLPQMAK